jgi:hypothetical protein
VVANQEEPVEPVTGFHRDPLFAGVDLMCHAALRSIGVDGAAVAVLTGTRRVRDLIYATDKIAHRLDELQFILGEGPCLDAVICNGVHLWADLDALGVQDMQWPAFATEALEAGARAVFAFAIPGPQRPLGALELYRRTAGALSAEETRCATAVAEGVGKLLTNNWSRYRSATGDTDAAIETAALTGADTGADSHPFSRASIHVAAGIVAVQLGVSPDEGIDRLRAHCYASRCSLDAVAADVIARRLTLDDHDGDERR